MVQGHSRGCQRCSRGFQATLGSFRRVSKDFLIDPGVLIEFHGRFQCFARDSKAF